MMYLSVSYMRSCGSGAMRMQRARVTQPLDDVLVDAADGIEAVSLSHSIEQIHRRSIST